MTQEIGNYEFPDTGEIMLAEYGYKAGIGKYLGT